MLRIHLPLLPLPVLAVIVAFSACSRPRSEEPAAHVIPPAAPYEPAAAAEPKPAEPTGAKPAVAAAGAEAEAAPSAQDVKEFERPVLK